MIGIVSIFYVRRIYMRSKEFHGHVGEVFWPSMHGILASIH